mgnify:CR=1 FL=1
MNVACGRFGPCFLLTKKRGFTAVVLATAAKELMTRIPLPNRCLLWLILHLADMIIDNKEANGVGMEDACRWYEVPTLLHNLLVCVKSLD